MKSETKKEPVTFYKVGRPPYSANEPLQMLEWTAVKRSRDWKIVTGKEQCPYRSFIMEPHDLGWIDSKQKALEFARQSIKTQVNLREQELMELKRDLRELESFQIK